VNARTACCTRFPSWPSTSSGTSFGVCVTKKTPTPFERPQQVGDVELRLAEELLPAVVLQLCQRAEQDADGLRRDAAETLELGLAVLRGEERQQCAQIGGVEERQHLVVRVPKDERQALRLRLVRVEDLREELRPEVGDGRAQGDAGAYAAQREELDRKALGLERLPELGGAGRRRAVGGAGRGKTGQIAFDIGREDRNAGRGKLLGNPCSVLVFPVPVAPAIRPWRFIVASGTWTTAFGSTVLSKTPLPSSSASPLTA
jgi:hypothetical protein